MGGLVFGEYHTSPESGKKRDDLIVGLRSFCIKQHVIFYRCNQEELEVVRILHGRMDIPAYFESH
jgi:toxin ParE1/3/4